MSVLQRANAMFKEPAAIKLALIIQAHATVLMDTTGTNATRVKMITIKRAMENVSVSSKVVQT